MKIVTTDCSALVSSWTDVKSEVSDFNSHCVLGRLARLPSPEKYWIGFSGGADSTALLQAMHESRENLQAPIHAVHFHHGLQDDADAWQDHCSKFCAERNIPFLSQKLEIDFWINILLCCFFVLPGVIHALYVVLQ